MSMDEAAARVHKVRTDPRTIRQAMEDARAIGAVAAATKYGVNHSQVYKWRKARAARSYVVREGDVWVAHVWPTDADIAEWHRQRTELGAERERRRRQAESYRRRRYLNRGPLLVPALGTVRRLRALQALGWTQRQLSEYVDVSAARIGHLSQGHRTNKRTGEDQVTTHVHIETAEAIGQLYRKLCMTLPPDPDSWVAKRQRRHARNLGWAPPLAWDDIDDPSEHRHVHREDEERRPQRRASDVDDAIVRRVLYGEILHTTKAERDKIMRLWRAGGRSEKELCERMSWKSSRYGKEPAA